MVTLTLRRIYRVHPAWWILGLIVLVLFSLNGSRSSFAVLYGPLEQEAGWSRVSLAGAATLGQMTMGVAFIVGGLAVDRYGPRRVLPLFALTHLAGFLLAARATEVWQIYFGFGLLGGLAFGIGVGPLLAIVARWFHRHQGLALGIGSSAGQMGAVVFAPLTALLADGAGWRWTFVLMGLIPFAVLLLAARFLSRSPQEGGLSPYGAQATADDTAPTTPSQRAEPSGISILEGLRRRELWLVCLIYFFANISTGLLMIHVVNHGRDEGLSAVTAASLLSVVTGVSVVGRVGGGMIADRADYGALFTASCLFMAAGVGLLAVNSHPALLYFASSAFGLGLGGAVVLQTIVGRAIVGERALGGAVGIILFAVNLGAGTGALIGGAMFEWAESYTPAFLIGAGGAAVASLGTIVLRSQLQPAGAES